MKLNKTLLSTLLLSFTIVGNVYAETAEEKFSRAVQYDKQQNYQAAFPIFKELAEQGYSTAQFNLALMYFEGQGVSQDYHQAAKWYQKAAEQGDASAQFNLGVMYDKGKGVRQDYHQAAKWYQKAAEQGMALAQTNLGVMYYKGYGVRQDKSKAKYYVGLACDNGDQTGCDNYRKFSEQGY
ncbi:tetratricopeptide repeat protein [Glaesserella parasuis]|uniref:tetratricopeptide repeat protein n=1 Tax=Glaesserella parasuis TaxID=738 RepID=UPI003CEA2557